MKFLKVPEICGFFTPDSPAHGYNFYGGGK